MDPQSAKYAATRVCDFLLSSTNPTETLLADCDALLTTVAAFSSTLDVIRAAFRVPCGDFVPVKFMLEYLFSRGFVAKLRDILVVVHGPLSSSAPILLLVQTALSFLEFVTQEGIFRLWADHESGENTVVKVLQETDLAGIVTMIDSLCMFSGPSRIAATLRPQPIEIVRAGVSVMRILNSIASYHLDVIQSTLSSSLRADFLHMIVFWLSHYHTWHAGALTTISGEEECEAEALVAELLTLLGYFSLFNQENQNLLRFGTSPVILQLVCELPFRFLSDPRLADIFFPTLMAGFLNNVENKRIVEANVSPLFFQKYLAKAHNRVDAVGTFNGRFPRGSWEI
ncbi:hypothetical protein M427DRAFT_425231 [Gonapodya prolifera JEL478]|uniref:DUF913-domain-containing protein n=1 Tax=Gonapodya prolifera (strain JEL478) TaxID=1344416 RepID=A0A139A5E9_GONPJ|nr:hypothetical protein M427DRAFT_425231 [Gonapodya prolifera JEL478]|eukprot:KXS11623.1 hypothetical protein M427DRAFT_425231 [Gonapodya prolifera JEL478]